MTYRCFLHYAALSIVCLVCSCGNSDTGGWQPSDPEATLEARLLFSRLMKLQKEGCMYGHQDDLMYGYHWWYDEGKSDTRELTGDYPAVAGFELGWIELGEKESLDGVNFDSIAARIRLFHKMNGIITISWHAVNPIYIMETGTGQPNGSGSAWDVRDMSPNGLNAVRSILPEGRHHALFNTWLDRLADFFIQLKDDRGRPIPFIFRPWHEHSGSFFWWGESRCTDDEYAALWRYTVNYLRSKGLHSILYAYNTDKTYSAEEYMKGYPGDEYVDMLTFDWYGQGEEFNRNIRQALDYTVRLASNRHKLHALSECGPITEELLELLADYESSYLLTWRDTYVEGTSGHKLKIEPGNPMLKMKHDPHFLFLNDINNLR
ncbi:MAG: hypothetical protein J5732_06760 [Bacteroidaceae bacterium]|nr:hypothetical protein [Bacteroidaceae bacterium]